MILDLIFERWQKRKKITRNFVSLELVVGSGEEFDNHDCNFWKQNIFHLTALCIELLWGIEKNPCH